MSTEAALTEVYSAVSGNSADPQAPVIVLCHGAMDRSAGMLRLSRQLDDHALVIRYDRRGYARSAAVGPPYTLGAHITDLAGVIERHAPDRQVALAFGHSLGGNVVLGLANQRPGLIERAVVYETPMSWLEWWPSRTGSGESTPDPADAAEGFMRRLIGDDRWERLPASTREGRRSEGAAMVGELADLRRQAPWDASLVNCPVLAISGEHGRPHHRKGMRLLAEMIDGAQYGQLDGAGHGAPNTHPSELADLVGGWLSRRAD